MPILLISPDEIVDIVVTKANTGDVIKSFSANANTFRLVLKVPKIPIDIKLNLQFHEFHNGKFIANYSGTIPTMFVKMLKNIVAEKTNNNVQIDNSQIIVDIDSLIADKTNDIKINSIKYENALYRLDMSII